MRSKTSGFLRNRQSLLENISKVSGSDPSFRTLLRSISHLSSSVAAAALGIQISRRWPAVNYCLESDVCIPLWAMRNSATISCHCLSFTPCLVRKFFKNRQLSFHSTLANPRQTREVQKSSFRHGELNMFQARRTCFTYPTATYENGK